LTFQFLREGSDLIAGGVLFGVRGAGGGGIGGGGSGYGSLVLVDWAAGLGGGWSPFVAAPADGLSNGGGGEELVVVGVRVDVVTRCPEGSETPTEIGAQELEWMRPRLETEIVLDSLS